MYAVSFLIFINLILGVNAVNYYITSESASSNGQPACNVNGFEYSFQLYQLNKKMLSNLNTLTLFLLPGLYRIPGNYTFEASGISILRMHPLIMYPLINTRGVEIQCQEQGTFVFENIDDLKIMSLNFTSCTVGCIGASLENPGIVTISSCLFMESKMNYSVTILNVRYTFVNYCMFDSNNGAVSVTSTSLSTPFMRVNLQIT